MVLDEVGNIMNNTSDRNEATAVLGLIDVLVPRDHGKLLQRDTPVEFSSLLVELLLELLNTTLLDFVRLELFQIIGKAKLLPHPDCPLGGVILMPFDGITIVRGKFVMEVVVTFTESDKSSDDVVTRRVAVVKWLVTKPVSQRVDAKGCLLDEEDSKNSSIDESTPPISPAEAGN